MILSRDAILSANTLPTADVEVPEWGGTVRLRMLSAIRSVQWSEAYERLSKAGDSVGGLRLAATLVALSVVGEDGVPLFTEADAELLAEGSQDAITKLFRAAMDLNGMTAASAEDVAKNSGADPSGDSTSD